MKQPKPLSNDPDAAEFELAKQRALDHLQQGVWIISDATGFVEFDDRLKLTEIVGQLNTLSRQLAEIGAQ